jgi:hypothetical protein
MTSGVSPDASCRFLLAAGNPPDMSLLRTAGMIRTNLSLLLRSSI